MTTSLDRIVLLPFGGAPRYLIGLRKEWN